MLGVGVHKKNWMVKCILYFSLLSQRVFRSQVFPNVRLMESNNGGRISVAAVLCGFCHDSKPLQKSNHKAQQFRKTQGIHADTLYFKVTRLQAYSCRPFSLLINYEYLSHMVGKRWVDMPKQPKQVGRAGQGRSLYQDWEEHNFKLW